MGFYEQAAERLQKEFGRVSGHKELIIRSAVRDALINFAGQDEEFAQVIVQGGSFPDCMAAVVRGVGSSISDLEAYEKAVRFYFPGSRVRFEMHIDLIGDAAGKDPSAAPGMTPLSPERGAGGGLVLDLADFL